jgi:hypothetical protein
MRPHRRCLANGARYGRHHRSKMYYIAELCKQAFVQCQHSGDVTVPHESLGRMSKVCYGVFDEALGERPAMSPSQPGRVPTTVPGCTHRTL